MKKFLLSLALLGAVSAPVAMAETLTLGGKEYEAEVVQQRDLGAGVIYQRLRIESYPLNVNMLIMDMSNPYARFETFQAQNTILKVEQITSAAARESKPGHKVLGGANSNFWCVSGQKPWSDLLSGVTYSANVKNGTVITETNMHSDKWNGGWKHTGVAMVDKNNKAYVGYYNFYGTVSNDKIGSPEIYQVNKVVRDDELTLYNKYYSTTKTFMPVNAAEAANKNFVVEPGVSTEVLLTLDEGQSQVIAKDFTATVKEVRKNAGTGSLGSYDLALVGKGSFKAELEKLEPGDVLTFNMGWSNKTNGKGTRPEIENAIAGNAMVLVDGEYTTYNDSESYNSQVYSRTGYATNADGSKMAIIVIDKSQDPIYGRSSGCNTKIMCDILMHYGFNNVVNMDAGGSAMMLVEGKVINKTTEGSPRSVANGAFFISTAPEDNTVARLEFDTYKMEIPVYSSFRPVILAYNKYGDIIDHDFRDAVISCDASVGSCNGDIFTAGGNEVKGNLTATYGDVTVTKEISIRQAALTLRIKPILIDAAREYPLEVTATVEGKVFTYDPATIEWTVTDPDVVAVNNGVLTGLKNGKTTITGKIGDFSETTEVTVEIAPEAKMALTNWGGYTVSGVSGISNCTISDDGLLGFTYASPRSPSVMINTGYTFYSLPDRLEITFTPSVTISYLLPELKFRDTVSKEQVKTAAGTEFAAGETHTVEIPMTEDMKDLINYPVTLSNLSFYIKSSSSWKGEQNIRINDLHAEYANSSGVENISLGSGENGSATNVMVALSGENLTVSSDAAINSVEIFNIGGAVVSSAEGHSTVVTMPAPAVRGVYVVRVNTAAGVAAVKMIKE